MMNNQTLMKPETDYFHYTCPRCHDWVGYYGLKSDYNFCKKCGVKLSWDGATTLDKLVVGSEWVCTATSYIDVEGHFIIQGERVIVSGFIQDLYVQFSDKENTKLIYDTFIEQFVHVFKPVSEGD